MYFISLMNKSFIKGKIDSEVIIKEGNLDKIAEKLNEIIDKVNILEAQLRGADSVKLELNVKKEVKMSDKIVKVLNSPLWDFVPFVGMIVLAATEGRQYWLGGVLAIVWLFTIGIRALTRKSTL